MTGRCMNRWSVAIGILLFALGTGNAWSQEIGKVAPRTTGKDSEEVEFSLEDYRGKIVVLFFWGDWCPPCRSTYEQFNTLVERHKDAPFALIGVNELDKHDRVAELRAEETIKWRSFLAADGESSIAESWKINAYPTIVLLDAAGTVKKIIAGARHDEINQSVNELVFETMELGEEELAELAEQGKDKSR